MVNKLDGFTSSFRLITPILLLFLTLLTGMAVTRLDNLCSQLRVMNGALDNHLRHDVVIIMERLARMEAKME